MSLFRQSRRKATPQEIDAILSAPGSTHEIARALGVSQALVWRVKKGLNGSGKPIKQDARVSA